MRTPIATFAPLALALLVGSGCGTAASSTDDLAATVDLASRAELGGAPDLAPSGPDLGCYPAPRTYEELLNGCTTAQAIDKAPVVPLLNKDGTLPPLP